MADWFTAETFAAWWKVLTVAPHLTVALLIFLFVGGYLAARWRYAAKSEHLEERIKLKDDLIAEYQRKLDGATPDEAKARLDALERRLDAMRPRSLSREQRSAITAMASRATGSISICTDSSCTDGAAFQADLSAAFIGAGWTVTNGMRIGAAATGYGLTVELQDQDQPSTLEQTAMAALNTAGLQFDKRESAFDFAGPTLMVTTRAT